MTGKLFKSKTKKTKMQKKQKIKVTDIMSEEQKEKYKPFLKTQQEQTPAIIPPPPPPPPPPPILTEEQRLKQEFSTNLTGYEKQLLKLLHGTGINLDKFTHIVISEVKRNKKLLQAFKENPSSMFASILTGAEIGLIPSETIGDFFLIPRNIKQPNGQFLLTVTPLIGYKGLITILLRGGEITRLHTEVVYEGDVFEPEYGLEPKIIHTPNFSVPRTADKIMYAYAVAKNKNGEHSFAVMTRKEIEGVRAMAKYENSIYFNDKEGINRWMERKSVLIQLGKMLPKDYYSKVAFSMDGIFQEGAVLTLEDNEVKVIKNGNTHKTTPRLRDIYGVLDAASHYRNQEPEEKK